MHIVSSWEFLQRWLYGQHDWFYHGNKIVSQFYSFSVTGVQAETFPGRQKFKELQFWAETVYACQISLELMHVYLCACIYVSSVCAHMYEHMCVNVWVLADKNQCFEKNRTRNLIHNMRKQNNKTRIENLVSQIRPCSFCPQIIFNCPEHIIPKLCFVFSTVK